MAYFKNFNNALYDFTIKTDSAEQLDIVQDLMTRSSLFISDDEMNIFTTPYLIGDGERPDIVAFKLYNDPTLHWTILYVNKRFDIYSDWPLSSDDLNQYVVDKYGVGNEGAIHHYEKLPEMFQMDLEYLVNNGYDYVSYTNLEHEIRMNEIKRRIRVIRPEFMSQFIQQFNKSFING